MSTSPTDSTPATTPKASASDTTPTSKPPAIPTFTPPAIKHFQSPHSGSPEDQAFARIQARNAKQIALNNAHKGGGRHRRRRRRRYQRGGAEITPPEAGGTANDEIVVPQSNTGVHVAGPENGNSASVVGNTTLAKGTMASQYDSEVEFTPTPGYAGSTQAAKTATAQGETATPPKSGQTGGRRRRGAPLPTYAEMLRDNPWMLRPDMIKQTRKMYPEMFHAKARHHRMVYRKRKRTKKRKKRKKRKRKTRHRRRKRNKRGGCTAFCLSGGRRRRRRTNKKKRTRKKYNTRKY